MHPRLVEIPFIHFTIWCFGPMMALGFLVGLALANRLARRAGLDPAVIMNVTRYSLIIGVIGARAFFVIHHFDLFRGDLAAVFAIWRGGLEFVGGVIPVIIFLFFYMRRHNLPFRKYLDILAIGLMMGLAFGRLGCFLNGCCFGKPANLPWAVRFPYRSYAYISQINPDPKRDRPEPQLNMPKSEYLSFFDQNGKWYPKPLDQLSDARKHDVTKGRYRCLATHPTQLYSAASALVICAVLYLLWRRGACGPDPKPKLARPGSTTAMAFLLYGVARFVIEALRDDNPYEFARLTISQITSIAMVALGIVLLILLARIGPPLERIRE
ncbi:MAG: prolipoprotein diacylglyceryl transferase [Phycisphaerales bacterium]|nr:MAG: prolipoprotein diacylglyceryl transferase [Phycisphaerales bacterium]